MPSAIVIIDFNHGDTTHTDRVVSEDIEAVFSALHNAEPVEVRCQICNYYGEDSPYETNVMFLPAVQYMNLNTPEVSGDGIYFSSPEVAMMVQWMHDYYGQDLIEIF